MRAATASCQENFHAVLSKPAGMRSGRACLPTSRKTPRRIGARIAIFSRCHSIRPASHLSFSSIRMF